MKALQEIFDGMAAQFSRDPKYDAAVTICGEFEGKYDEDPESCTDDEYTAYRHALRYANERRTLLGVPKFTLSGSMVDYFERRSEEQEERIWNGNGCSRMSHL